ncbi:short-chain fatty acyl-CoA regulator family protein [Pararhodobacter aggregans]|nr:short-chain fatty acyl-CoA regulator family protein [Pararhodobacter aggregans]
MPIGVNCYLCERPDCPSRAYPPINRLFSFSERSRGVSSFGFAPDTN